LFENQIQYQNDSQILYHGVTKRCRNEITKHGIQQEKEQHVGEKVGGLIEHPAVQGVSVLEEVSVE